MQAQLISAVKNGDAGVLTSLLESPHVGSFINYKDAEKKQILFGLAAVVSKRTALGIAAREGRVQFVKMLLQKGADTEAKDAVRGGPRPRRGHACGGSSSRTPRIPALCIAMHR